ncbi:MAG TPA: amino-acid N-acetyltransferase [Gammaproteobacteria bacterium]|nr:amino-acid N-acetyltransferase [Gammaproteobacteria bacterium]|tara:strand:+ start:1285 stop:2604 length:1320 start_codon:yes stop_codon:yes gene_type:complete
MSTSDYTSWFRGSTPYIRAHRGKTFVVVLGGEILDHTNLTNIVHDLALLHVLGVKLVLSFGVRPQVAALLPKSKIHEHRRVTDPTAIDVITAACGQQAAKLQALFSTGLPNTPLHNVDIDVVQGNLVTAQPIGVIAGVDHLLTGRMRKFNAALCNQLLDQGAIVLLPPLGFSTSGQAFNLVAEDLASSVSQALGADKLVVFSHEAGLVDASEQAISTLTTAAAPAYLSHFSETTQRHLNALTAAVSGGVGKGHLISCTLDGALLEELFTAEGSGTQVVPNQVESVRPANLEDISAIVEIIRPLEEQGILVKRSRDRLEQEIDQFLVAETDGIVAGCCAVYPSEQDAELACLAVHERFRDTAARLTEGTSGKRLGEQLLAAAKQRALTLSATRLFALTTQSQDWFLQQGFTEADVAKLSDSKQAAYNWQRGAKILYLNLD